MKKEKVIITYGMIKRTGKEDRGQIALVLPDRSVYRIVKQETTKEELWLYCLVDILAKLQGYEKGKYITLEVDSS